MHQTLSFQLSRNTFGTYNLYDKYNHMREINPDSIQLSWIYFFVNQENQENPIKLDLLF